MLNSGCERFNHRCGRIPCMITNPFFSALVGEGVSEGVLRNPTDAETRRRGSPTEDVYLAPQVKVLEPKQVSFRICLCLISSRNTFGMLLEY